MTLGGQPLGCRALRPADLPCRTAVPPAPTDAPSTRSNSVKRPRQPLSKTPGRFWQAAHVLVPLLRPPALGRPPSAHAPSAAALQPACQPPIRAVRPTHLPALPSVLDRYTRSPHPLRERLAETIDISIYIYVSVPARFSDHRRAYGKSALRACSVMNIWPSGE